MHEKAPLETLRIFSIWVQGLDLEDAHGVGLAHRVVHLLVAEVDAREVDALPPALLDEFQTSTTAPAGRRPQ